MERFSAAFFNWIGEDLKSLTLKVERVPAELDITEVAESYKPMLELIQSQCEKIGLRVSVRCAGDYIGALGHGMTVGQFRQRLEELGNTIRREMQSEVFFHMPGKRAEFYGQGELFGAGVNTKFPTIQFDMVEAGNCYATGRGTACVFHLMRIMETGVQRFGDTLGVTLTGQKSWQNILDGVNKAIKALPAKDPTVVEKSQASANLYAVKLAWRNEVMHPNDTYTLEEAENLIGQVKVFMVQLASIIEP